MWLVKSVAFPLTLMRRSLGFFDFFSQDFCEALFFLIPLLTINTVSILTVPELLEAYAKHFDDLLGKSNQRDEFRHYLESLLLQMEHHETLTGLANTEPSVGAQHSHAQGMRWFLSELT